MDTTNKIINEDGTITITTTEANGATSTATIDTAKVEAITKELEAFTADMKDKVYPVKIETSGVLAGLHDFIMFRAPWKNMEALGIIEIIKALKAEKEVKSGNIYLKSLPIQAISFFLSKVESKGLEDAEQHIKFVKPIDEALRLIKLDNDNVNILESKLAAAENGIGIEPTPEK